MTITHQVGTCLMAGCLTSTVRDDKVLYVLGSHHSVDRSIDLRPHKAIFVQAEYGGRITTTSAS